MCYSSNKAVWDADADPKAYHAMFRTKESLAGHMCRMGVGAYLLVLDAIGAPTGIIPIPGSG